MRVSERHSRITVSEQRHDPRQRYGLDKNIQLHGDTSEKATARQLRRLGEWAKSREECSQHRPRLCHFPFGPRGSTVSGQHSNFRYPCLNLLFIWSKPTSEPERVALIPLPIKV